jgi:hypothetical protein
MTCQVYGHIVASDSLNEAYIVPLRAIFDQIKNYPGINLVRLAGENDIQKWRSQHADSKALVRKGAKRSHGVGAFVPINAAPCVTISSNIRESKTSTKRTVGRKGVGAVFSETAPVEPSNQPYNNQSIPSWALSLNQVSPPFLTSLGSNTQQPKLYRPPAVASFCMEGTQESPLKLDVHEITQVPSRWDTTQSPSDLDSISSPSWSRLLPETESEIIGAFTSRRKYEQSKKLPISPMEELSNLISDELRETPLEYQRQYGTIEPCIELPAPLALKDSSWDSGYSTAESANHSPAP